MRSSAIDFQVPERPLISFSSVVSLRGAARASFAVLASTCVVVGAAHGADLPAPAAPAAIAVPAPPVNTLPTFLSLPAWPGPSTGPRLRVGAYVGKISDDALIDIIFRPWTIDFEHSYIVAAQAIYTAYRFQAIPLDLEIEGDVAHRFGDDHQSEVDLIPMARWKWLPWNNIVYTNIRVGLLGASYVNGISPTEIRRSGVGHGSHYLNFLVPELTFAPSAESNWEVFIRVHHRSGIFGLIDGIHGASNYVSVGARFGVF